MSKTPKKVLEGPLRLDLQAIERMRGSSVSQLEPGIESVVGMHVHFIATGGKRGVAVEGVVRHVVDRDHFVADLVYVDKKSLQADFPLLLVVERSRPSCPQSNACRRGTARPHARGRSRRADASSFVCGCPFAQQREGKKKGSSRVGVGCLRVRRGAAASV